MQTPRSADIHIVYSDSEWQLVKEIARLLDARGYRVSPSRVMELPNHPELDIPPADAKALLVVWPVRHELFDKPALEARAASKRKHLVQIYAGTERPEESYDGPPGVDFTSWNLTPSGPKWAALMRRLSALCGPPPKPVIDVKAAMPTVVLASTVLVAVIAGCASLLQQAQPHLQADKGRTPADGAQREPTLAPLAEGARAVHLGAETGRGGPLRYTPEAGDPDRDTGVTLAPTTAQERAAPAPAKRAPQGPEQ